jgi:hypothetical protein
MKKKAKKTPKAKPKSASKSFGVYQMPDCWIAHCTDDNLSGFLLYNKQTQKYHAWVSEILIHFPQLARAHYKSADDCPVDENHNPKADLLMLIALRKRFKEDVPDSQLNAITWRRMAFLQRRKEVEKQSGKPLSEVNWAHCMALSVSEDKFEEYAANWLMALVCDDRASEILVRLGKWLKKVEELGIKEIPDNYKGFLSAVETAAENVQGVPKQSEVKKIYEKGLSRNQLGQEHGLRDLMRQLHFDWLPAAGRGPSTKPKISGIRARN